MPLPWYGKTAVELEIRHAAAIAGNLLQRSIELRRAKPRRELVFDLDDEI